MSSKDAKMHEQKRVAADIRAKMSELNSAVANAASVGVQVEYSFHYHNTITSTTPVVCAEIKVVI